MASQVVDKHNKKIIINYWITLIGSVVLILMFNPGTNGNHLKEFTTFELPAFDLATLINLAVAILPFTLKKL